MVKTVVTLLIAVLGAVLFVFAPGGYWFLGASIFVVAWLFLLLVIIPFTRVSRRGQLAFLASGALVTALAASGVLLAAPAPPENGGWVVSLADISVRLLATINGIFVTIIAIPIFFIVVGYFSSIYVVALHEEEMDFWTAFKSYIYLILGINLPWLLVEDGKIIELRKQGFANKWLSRGKIIIKPGNAIVTERGGSITGIHGPGVIITQKGERIRGDVVYDLRPQVAIKTVENVITADQIPLEIELGIGYKITPFEKSPANVASKNGNKKDTTLKIFKEKKYGLFPVSEATLMRAAFNGTAGGWKGFGDNAPIGQLRDQIMAHDFKELFQLAAKDDDLKLRVNKRQIKRIEDAILETLNGFADAAIGLTFTFIDIREIRLPEDIAEAVHMRIKSAAEADAIEKIEGQRNSARRDLVSGMLVSIGSVTNKLGPNEMELARAFASITRRALTDDVLGHQYIDMLKTIASGDAMKIFNVTPSPTAVEPEHIPDLQSLSENGKKTEESVI